MQLMLTKLRGPVDRVAATSVEDSNYARRLPDTVLTIRTDCEHDVW